MPPAQSAPSAADELITQIAGAADEADRTGASIRPQVAALAAAGLAGLGAPANRDGGLPAMAQLIREVAGVCLSTAFSLWAHRMTIEYLRAAGTPWALDAAGRLERGEALGVTGMASAFKDLAGCGELDLAATPAPGGWAVSGVLRWASNLHPDSIMVSAARAEDGRKLVIGVPLGSGGVAIADRFDLLALGSTDSSSVALSGVSAPAEQVLSDRLEDFLGQVAPTFLALQSAMCLGLAERCLQQTRASLHGVNASIAPDLDRLDARLADASDRLSAVVGAVGTDAVPSRPVLLRLRLDAGTLAAEAAGLEIRTAGGRGYARDTDASRRFREAAFIPVQSPSETQLRWELDAVGGDGPR